MEVPSLENIPSDILQEDIFPRLTYDDLRQVALTSKTMRAEVSTYLNHIHRFVIHKQPILGTVEKHRLMRILAGFTDGTFAKYTTTFLDGYIAEVHTLPQSFELRLGEHYYKSHLYPNGTLKDEYWYLNDKFHRIDAPAVVRYHTNGQRSVEAWYLDGAHHRLADKPATTHWFENGNCEAMDWYLHGRRHRDNLPAALGWRRTGPLRREEWYQNGRHHRIGHPAKVSYYESGLKSSEEWFRDGLPWRINGPVHILYNEQGEAYHEEWAMDE